MARTWFILSEVPGWPDAPLALRLRRVAPILVALTGILAFVVWKQGWRNPEVRTVRASHSPLVALDEEINALRMVCSDQQALDAAAEAEQAGSLLLASPDEVPALLARLRETMRAQGWEATFQAYDALPPAAGETAAVQFVVARARLVPVEGHPAAFQSLLGVFDQFSTVDKRIDLTRLGVRADEPGKIEVELNLRVACRVPHEEAS